MSVIGTCLENETAAETGYFDRLLSLVVNDWRCNRFYTKNHPFPIDEQHLAID